MIAARGGGKFYIQDRYGPYHDLLSDLYVKRNTFSPVISLDHCIGISERVLVLITVGGILSRRGNLSLQEET